MNALGIDVDDDNDKPRKFKGWRGDSAYAVSVELNRIIRSDGEAPYKRRRAEPFEDYADEEEEEDEEDEEDEDEEDYE